MTTKRTDINHPASFKEGVRVLLLMLRAKDGGSAKTDRRATKKVVTQSAAEFDEALAELRSLWQPDQRIYSTINARALHKAQRIFNYRLLDAQYFAPADRDAFYLDLENRWISCLKDSQASAGSLFLLDIDGDEVQRSTLINGLYKVQQSILGNKLFDVVDRYSTRNGEHLITTPFNPAILPFPPKDILHKNALMLWSY